VFVIDVFIVDCLQSGQLIRYMKFAYRFHVVQAG
jgi:hypothetical protein